VPKEEGRGKNAEFVIRRGKRGIKKRLQLFVLACYTEKLKGGGQAG